MTRLNSTMQLQPLKDRLDLNAQNRRRERIEHRSESRMKWLLFGK